MNTRGTPHAIVLGTVLVVTSLAAEPAAPVGAAPARVPIATTSSMVPSEPEPEPELEPELEPKPEPKTEPRPKTAPRQLLRSELFTFHSDVFVNSHHFLYRWGQAGPGADVSNLNPSIRVLPEDLEVYERMDPSERAQWDVPATVYRLEMIDRDLLFDEGMVALRDCLVMAGNFCDRLAAGDEAIVEMLAENIGLYRMFFWDRHNQANRAWIAEMIPLAQRFEAAMSPRIAAAYTGAWPESRHRVDVSYYANRVGGYTTSDGHITISSIGEGNQGYLGLELLFHEASHGESLEGPLRRLIRRSFDAIGADTPRDLWHMTIFYTAGHVTRAVLAEAGIDYPQTYAELSGMFERREDNIRAEAALDAHWKAALDAGQGFEEAMMGVARAWEAWGPPDRQ